MGEHLILLDKSGNVCPPKSLIKLYPQDPTTEFTLDFTDHVVLQATRWECEKGNEENGTEESTYRFMPFKKIEKKELTK